MRRTAKLPNFSSWSAIVLHRPHATADGVLRQLERIGIAARSVWPALAPDEAAADVVFFDVDMGHDGQFPWPAGRAPMPLIALVGSEAPGRLEWAIAQGADSYLMKPVGSAGVYSALIVARHAFAARASLLAEVGELRDRLSRRPNVARALVAIMNRENIDDAAAFRRLREIAMETRRTIEDAADVVLARNGHPDVARNSA
jgi:AmiR/NasT family two-component response regulator